MPDETRLATILHISDLHFGKMDNATGDAVLATNPPGWWRHFGGRFEGLLGHHYPALVHLHDFCWNTLQDEAPLVVVTGDLTRTGHSAEFMLVWTFLENQIPIRPGEQLGLRDSRVRELSIPGNHDHWPGRQFYFGAPHALAANFTPAPSIFRYVLPTGQVLLLVGIDSDADVGSSSVDRFLARGKFLSQIRAVEALLTPADANEIRVLLVHHSLMHRGAMLGMSTRSRKALESLIEQRDFKVMLSGHMHLRATRSHRCVYGETAWDMLEARCGTTTQRDVPPTTWSAGFGKSSPGRIFSPNCLLVHRIIRVEQDAGYSIEWRCEAYQRTRRGFIAEQKLASNQHLAVDRIPIWPT